MDAAACEHAAKVEAALARIETALRALVPQYPPDPAPCSPQDLAARVARLERAITWLLNNDGCKTLNNFNE